ncbi:MAG TPA: sulfotransferase [Rhodanobacteraceae bacterium]|nr:sulfotransferase [Rhodanobacteraceae bacterium]
MAHASSVTRKIWQSRVSDLDPRVAKRLELLAGAIRQRQLRQARDILVTAMASAPEHRETLRLEGLLLHLEGQHAQAIEVFQAALANDPGDALMWTNLGSALRADEQMDQALAAFTTATELAPELAAGWYNLGKTLKLTARLEQAREALARALRLEPEHIGARMGLGDTLKALGLIDAAVTEYRAVLARDSAHGAAWFGLANLKTVPLGERDVVAMRRILRRPDLEATTRVNVGFALAKALEDCQQHAQAWPVLATANALKHRLTPWNGAAHSRWMRQIEQAFARPLTATPPATHGGEIIFVVSMPRSGSTLIEQILSAHADVEGAGELVDLPRILDQETRRTGQPFVDWVTQAGAADWQRLGMDYLARTQRWRETRARSTDKSLLNWQFVGAALAMLPAARVVVCRREPLETCLACFRQLFSTGAAFSYDIDDLANYWHAFDRLCRHWETQFPGRVRSFHLEHLQQQPEVTIRTLLEHCGLPFDAACLTPHKSMRGVRSASAAQVRQPIRADSARAGHYGAALAQLVEALQAPVDVPSTDPLFP